MRVRELAPEELDRFFDALALAFGTSYTETERRVSRPLLDPARALVAVDDDGTICATAGSFAFQMALPGTTGSVAGVTEVSVAPHRRRRGLLTALMDRQLADLKAAGREPVAALFASEAAIYGRFGYGMAAREAAVTVTGRPRYRHQTGSDAIRIDDPAALRAEMAAIHDRCWRVRPGHFARNDLWWDKLLARDPADADGRKALTAVTTPHGYAVYRTDLQWRDGSAAGSVQLLDLLGETPEAEAQLWRHLTDLDLMTEVNARGMPVDLPLPHLLADRRAVRMQVRDNLWLRIVDLRAALTARRYATPADLVLEVRDERCPWNQGRFRLQVTQQGATCEPTRDPADLEMDAAALGASYLGGTTLIELAAAGQVRELRPGSLAPASVAFRGLREPVCPWIF
jgi:predicted acetyltransferase